MPCSAVPCQHASAERAEPTRNGTARFGACLHYIKTMPCRAVPCRADPLYFCQCKHSIRLEHWGALCLLHASARQGGPDKLLSLRNNHMTILHSSLYKYICAVHDLHCILRYISTYTRSTCVQHSMKNEYVAVKTFSRFLGCFSWPQSPLGSFTVDYKAHIALKEGRHPAKAVSN